MVLYRGLAPGRSAKMGRGGASLFAGLLVDVLGSTVVEVGALILQVRNGRRGSGQEDFASMYRRAEITASWYLEARPLRTASLKEEVETQPAACADHEN